MCRGRRLYTIILSIVLPIVLLAAIAAIIATQVQNADDSARTGPISLGLGEDEDNHTVCYPDKVEMCDDCEAEAKYFLSGIDFEVNPCDDFYHYACGKNPLILQEYVKEKYRNSTRAVINRGKASALGTIPENFYKSCIDTEKVKNLGVKPVLDILQTEFNLPRVPDYFYLQSHRHPWMGATGKIKRLLDLDLFFSLNINLNGDGAKFIIELGSGPLDVDGLFKSVSLIGRKRLKNDEETRLTVMKMLLRQESTSSEILKNASRVVASMQNDLKDMALAHNSRRNWIRCKSFREFDVEFDYEFFRKFQKPTNFWQKFLDGLFSTKGFDETSKIFCYGSNSVAYLADVIGWCLNQAPDHLQLYMWYYAASTLLPLTADFDDTLNSDSREELCIDLVGEFLESIIAFEVYKKRRKTYLGIYDMLKEIQNSFIERVESVDWIDAKTRMNIFEKLKSRVDVFGLPAPGLEVLKRMLPFELYPDQFLKNSVKIAHARHAELLGKVNTNYKRAEFFLRKTPVNFEYRHSTNTLFVHDEYLDFPFFYGNRSTAFKVLNYGLLGSRLGQGIVAGFGSEGMKHDKFGDEVKPEELWSESALKTMNEIFTCFTKTLSDSSLLDVNLADNGGLRHSYRSYKMDVAKNGCGLSLPGLSHFTDDQLFFIAFAKYFCEPQAVVFRLGELKERVLRVRLMRTLQNSPSFAQAFRCTKGQIMNPRMRKRCILW